MLKRFLITIAAVIGIGIALWLSVMLFFGLAVVGAGAYLFYVGRRYLTEKGILNPQFGVPNAPVEEERITIIEGDFERIEEKEKS